MPLRVLVRFLVSMCVLLATLVGLPLSAGSASRFASEERATIRPGVQMFTRGAQCTGNFVFTDDRGRLYVGYAAHCAGTGEATDVDGCRAPSYPLGTRVSFRSGETAVTEGTVHGRGRLVYSSWLAMRRRGEGRPHVCRHNDFALVKVGRRHVGKVNPTFPSYGGPEGVTRDRPEPGEEVYSYGASLLRPGWLLSPKSGQVVDSTGRGWSYDVYTLTPGVPGDSGSGFLDASGTAFGVLSTLAVTPMPASNGVSDLRKMLRYARRHSGIEGLRLVPGTRSFRR